MFDAGRWRLVLVLEVWRWCLMFGAWCGFLVEVREVLALGVGGCCWAFVLGAGTWCWYLMLGVGGRCFFS